MIDLARDIIGNPFRPVAVAHRGPFPGGRRAAAHPPATGPRGRGTLPAGQRLCPPRRTRVRAVARPLRLHVAAVEEEPRRTVLVHESGTEHLGQLPEAAAALEVDLEKAVPGGVHTLGEEEVVVVVRIDVRDPGGVDGDLDLSVLSPHSAVSMRYQSGSSIVAWVTLAAEPVPAS